MAGFDQYPNTDGGYYFSVCLFRKLAGRKPSQHKNLLCQSDGNGRRFFGAL